MVKISQEKYNKLDELARALAKKLNGDLEKALSGMRYGIRLYNKYQSTAKPESYVSFFIMHEMVGDREIREREDYYIGLYLDVQKELDA